MEQTVDSMPFVLLGRREYAKMVDDVEVLGLDVNIDNVICAVFLYFDKPERYQQLSRAEQHVAKAMVEATLTQSLEYTQSQDGSSKGGKNSGVTRQRSAMIRLEKQDKLSAKERKDLARYRELLGVNEVVQTPSELLPNGFQTGSEGVVNRNEGREQTITYKQKAESGKQEAESKKLKARSKNQTRTRARTRTRRLLFERKSSWGLCVEAGFARLWKLNGNCIRKTELYLKT